MISLSAWEKRSKLLGGQGAGEHLLLSAVNAILSVREEGLERVQRSPR